MFMLLKILCKLHIILITCVIIANIFRVKNCKRCFQRCCLDQNNNDWFIKPLNYFSETFFWNVNKLCISFSHYVTRIVTRLKWNIKKNIFKIFLNLYIDRLCHLYTVNIYGLYPKWIYRQLFLVHFTSLQIIGRSIKARSGLQDARSI